MEMDEGNEYHIDIQQPLPTKDKGKDAFSQLKDEQVSLYDNRYQDLAKKLIKSGYKVYLKCNSYGYLYLSTQ